MTVDVRRSSRRSLVVEKKTKAENAAPVSKRQPKKKPSIVDVVKDQAQTQEKKKNDECFKPKNFTIRVYKLKESKGDYKLSDIAPVAKLSKEEKQLLIPKKSNKTVKTTTGKKKRGRQPKKGGKFQLKIKQNNEADDGEESSTEENDDDRPDSGFSSRADTPRSLSESAAKSDKANDENGELNEDMENENKKFLAELDEGLSSEEEEEESDWDGDSDDGFKKAAKKPAKKTKKQLKTKAALNAPITMPELPGAMKSELSQYDKIRENNIKERQDMLAALMADFADFKSASGIGAKSGGGQKRKRKERVVDPGELRKSSRLSQKPEDKEKLGSEKWNVDGDGRFRLAEEYSDYDSDDYEIYEAQQNKRRQGGKKASKDANIGVLMPEDITETMLNKVIDRFGEKVYNQEIGTTCHQCRQKTVDMKTVCRSGYCVGVRGQFCGRCLALRYGEDAREALMDPEWKCPPCRNFCNCSICRNRNGKGATGILINLAQAKGYSNVADYLKALTRKTGSDEFDDE